jgi:hypothetical protein
MNCARCQKNPARVRVDQMVNGRRESHYLCQQCVDEFSPSGRPRLFSHLLSGLCDGFGLSRTPPISKITARIAMLIYSLSLWASPVLDVPH